MNQRRLEVKRKADSVIDLRRIQRGVFAFRASYTLEKQHGSIPLEPTSAGNRVVVLGDSDLGWRTIRKLLRE